jgi:hypothetical protein
MTTPILKKDPHHGKCCQATIISCLPMKDEAKVMKDAAKTSRCGQKDDECFINSDDEKYSNY